MIWDCRGMAYGQQHRWHGGAGFSAAHHIARKGWGSMSDSGLSPFPSVQLFFPFLLSAFFSPETCTTG